MESGQRKQDNKLAMSMGTRAQFEENIYKKDCTWQNLTTPPHKHKNDKKKCGNIQATNMYTNKWFKIIKIMGKFNGEGSTKW